MPQQRRRGACAVACCWSASLLLAAAQTPGVPHGGGACATDFDCSLGGTCDASKCRCDPWFTGATCALLNLQAPLDDQNGLCGAGFDSYYSWGGRALPDADGQWHLYASFICDHDNLKEWTSQSSSAHFISPNATGPFEFSPEQCDDHGICTPSIVPWSHNTVGFHNASAAAGAADAWQIWHVGDGVVNRSVWSPCFNRSEVGGRANHLRAVEVMASAFDCRPFNCTCQGWADWYGADQSAPHYGTGCAPPDAVAWSAAQKCRTATTGAYCVGHACTPSARREYCVQKPANPGAHVYVATAPRSDGPWTYGLENTPLPILYNQDRAVWPQSATNPSPLEMPDGSVNLYFTSADTLSPCGLVSNCVGMATSKNGWEGPFVPVEQHITYPESEDPHVFRDPRGNFHMLTNVNTCHRRCAQGVECGGHAWSTDGRTWSNLTVGAFGPVITLANGTVWKNAYTERPLVTQAEDGTPLAFFVGMGRTAYMDCCNWAQLFCTGKPGQVCGPTISYPNGTTASGQY